MSSDSTATRRGWLLPGCAVLLFAISLTLLWQRMYMPHEWGDEGYFSNAALRILDGQVLYRDFQHNYPPGRMYALALLIKIFGRDLAVVRIFWCVLHALSVSLSLLVARRLMPLPFALGAAGAVLLNGAHQNKSTELLAAAAVLLVVFRVLEGRTSDGAAGLWLGVIGLFRHDTAAVGVGLFVLAIALRVWIEREPSASAWNQILARSKRAWPFAIGLAAAIAPFGIYLAFEGALGQAIRELLFSGFSANRSLALPFPTLVQVWSPGGLWESLCSSRIVYYIPIAVYAVSLVIALRRLGKPDRSISAGQLLLICLLGSALFVQVVVRTDPGHLDKAYVPAHILSLFLVWKASSQSIVAARSRRRWAAVGSFALAAVALAMPTRHLIEDSVAPWSLPRMLSESTRYELVPMPYGRLAFPERWAPRFRKLADEIASHPNTHDDEYLLAFPAGGTFNFLSGYRNPLRYDVLRPGELGGNDPATLRKILERIAQTRPRYMVHVKERTNHGFAIAIRRYARKHGYRAIPFGRLTLLIRPDEPIPSTRQE